ncbi:MAG: hypothetical protein C0613_00845 [Desulfobulbaceae bacterium]|nr:MAG: hypothetical protein C0613_00845 [Desulfobulbaceae bacterium]
MKNLLHTTIAPLFVVLVLLLPHSARADVTTDIEGLVHQAAAVEGQFTATSLSPEVVCAPLTAAHQAARALVEDIEAVNSSLAAPITIDDTMLIALEGLFMANVELADEVGRLAAELQLLVPAADTITIKDGLTAMLQLSDDIGTMADRIGEMADRILVMADNIGLMADRILVTQEIQNQNVAMTQATLLQTQTNMLTLVSAVETASYDLDLNSLAVQGELLAADLTGTVFSPWTIKYQLAAAADDVRNFMVQGLAMADQIESDSATSTMVIDDSTMLAMNNMASMASSVAIVLDGYNLALQSMVAALSDQNLSASIGSMLEMSADIGVMANSIGEMADLILAMADNIGLTAEQILLTQQLQSDYLAISQASILATQEMAISLIVAEGLQ